jgi:hypothetical protein
VNGYLHMLALAFVASFVFIFLKAWQQLNVVHHQLWWVMPTSMGMAVCEVYVVSTVAIQGWGWVVLSVGLGSGLGCVASMLVHKRMRKD